MSLLRRMFSAAYRRARKAEARGDYREAAELYVAADDPESAANALLFLAARHSDLEARLAAYHDALRWLPEDHERRPQVQGRIGLAVLQDAQERGARTAEERRRLTDAAERLEEASKHAEAATAWEILGRLEDTARCLQLAGEVERLEALLDRTSRDEDRDRKLRRHVRDYEVSMATGERVAARASLRAALEVAPDDAAIADLLRRLDERLPKEPRVELAVGERRLLLVGRLPATLGRVGADVPLRGTGVSRRHAEIDVGPDGHLVLRDLGSRNGTLIRGVPIGGEVELAGATEVGLGDDVSVVVTPAAGAVTLEVASGLDRSLRVVVGRGALPLPELSASVSFEGGHATLIPDAGAELWLGEQRCTTPVVLLIGDRVALDGTTLEVRA